MSTETLTLIERERRLLDYLKRSAAERAKGEATAELGFSEQAKAAEATRDRRILTAQSEHQNAKSTTESEYRRVRETTKSKFESDFTSTKREYDEALANAAEQFQVANQLAAKAREDSRWAADAQHEASRTAARLDHVQLINRINLLDERGQAVRQQTNQTLIDFGQEKLIDSVGETIDLASIGPDPVAQLEAVVAESEPLLERLKQLRIPKLFAGSNLVWVFTAMWFVFAIPCFKWLDPLIAFVGSLALAGVIGGIVSWLLLRLARSHTANAYRPLGESLANQIRLTELSQKHGQQTNRKRREQIEKLRADEFLRIESEFEQATAAIKAKQEAERAAAKSKYPPLLESIKTTRDRLLQEAEAKYPQLLKDIEVRLATETRESNAIFEQTIQQLQQTKRDSWQAVVDGWKSAISIFEKEAKAIAAEGKRDFADWPAFAETKRPAAQAPASQFRIGDFDVAAAKVPSGVPADERLATVVPGPQKLPAISELPATGCLLIEATDRGRDAALDVVRAYMLRLLVNLPPGKVRFTIVDPVGLGENFAAFMHLADFDEAMVTNRIWTEPQHIEQRLADLTQTIENVIQKYLRNEFESIEAYNRQAGEVAEPFRFVVVANFPAGFNEATSRRLISIASSGSRCGVFTLVTVDRKLPLPQGVSLADLASAGIHLVWNGGGFTWKDADFEPFTLQVDKPPTGELLTKILHLAGERAKDANRVEVPFDTVAPPEDQWWKHETRAGIRAPIGRAGATRFQFMALGKGTSQHVLIAGKTGSGKSSLLHALITSLALQYSPDELELYLLDFKKGVEFKSYATHGLPHARVVGIESEREFGLSVLQRLDIELKDRGDRFRDAGVQDISSFRDARPDMRMPRILLIVDEFQEFFVDDDRIAQEVSLLLDRLVRQGRAFGVHVLLGSQTLGGAYSLARSTVGQMAVRIALQCSETDAHLILSDDNPAARLLSRPGEAIYNDANGLLEGNNLFQVVWLPDDRKDDYLNRLTRHAASNNGFAVRPQVVFEGNIPSDVRVNFELNGLLERPPATELTRKLKAWLGEAVAIKDPTAAVFSQRTGANLLLVGQQPEASLGAVMVGIVALAAQMPHRDSAVEFPSAPTSPTFVILDGTPDESPLAGRLAAMPRMLPQATEFASPKDSAPLISKIAAEVERRQGLTGEQSPVFLVVFDIQRFRELRKADDDFGFSKPGEAASPAKLLAQILKDGPALGVHTIVWCDSPNNLSRTFDRQTLREFEMKVVFQMSANDSSNLIDTPLASKLGVHRAFFASEEEGVLEKFRPYGIPPADWLQKVKEQFRRASRHTPDAGTKTVDEIARVPHVSH